MDSTRKLVIILVIGVVAVFGVIAIRSWLASAPPPETPVVKDLHILVAARDLPLGTVVQPAADLAWQVTAPEDIKPENLVDNAVQMESFNSAIVRRVLRAGEPVTQSALTRANEGSFMSAVLEPGMRAVTIAVTPTSGNAGFISPGDRVDLIVTHRIRTLQSSNPDGSVVSQTFVRDVRVIAVDQQLNNPDNQAMLAKTVTVEVTPHQAEQIAVAGDLGKISFTLRSLANEDLVAETVGEDGEALALAVAEEKKKMDGIGYTRDSDISQALESGGYSSTIRIIRGDQVENVTLR